MIKVIRTFCAIGLIGALAACSSKSGDGNAPLSRVLAASIFTSVKAKRAGPPQDIRITRAMLDATKVAALQVKPEKTGGTDFLRRVAERSDSFPGKVEVWKSTDSAHIYMRNGVIIGTRGVGGDIISSDVAPIISAVRGARSGGGERRMFIDQGSYTAVEIQLACEIENLGSEKVIVVYKEFSTNHLRETCIGGPTGKTKIVNDYWVQPGSGIVRKSRQWVGPYSGYFDILLLKV